MFETVGNLLVFAGTTGLTVAILNNVVNWWKDRAAAERRKAHLALRIAVSLERFVSDVLNERAILADEIEQRHLPSRFSLGTPPQFPDDNPAWEYLDASLSGRILNLQMEILVQSRDLAYLSSHLDNNALADEYLNASVLLASDAWSLATELREKYGYPLQGLVHAGSKPSPTAMFLEQEGNKIVAKNRALGHLDSIEDGC